MDNQGDRIIMCRIWCAAFLTPLLLGGCSTTYRAGAPKGAVDVIAHRGASAYAPENTLAAFEKAVELRADWFELDCMLTADGQVVVHHDKDLDRTAGVSGRVWDLTLAELRQLDVGAWFHEDFRGERIPSLGEALDLARGRIGVYVEIKNSDDDQELIGAMSRAVAGAQRLDAPLREELRRLVEESGTRNLPLTRATIGAIRERGMEEQVVVQSFSPVVCYVAKEEAPDLRVEFLGSENKDHPGEFQRFLEFGYLIGVDGFNVSKDTLSPERVAAFHQNGKSVAVWTVDDPRQMKDFAAWGADSIITNRPDVCLEVLGR